jgi:hypothetical protein
MLDVLVFLFSLLSWCLLLYVLVSYVKYLSAELLAGIRKERETGSLPSHVASGMEELYHNYKNAVNK